MLGYSDLLLNTRLSAEQQPLAAKIGQYVRRTRSLVASLISFARHTPAPKIPLDLNTLVRTAVKLTEPHWKSLELDVQTSFDSTLPKVVGDSNQLLQVCLQLIGNALHVLSERDGTVLTVSTEQNAGTCLLRIVTPILSPTGMEQQGVCSPLEPEDAMGLTACQGIVQEHHGRVFRERRESGSITLCMELPAAVLAPAPTKQPTAPVMWQSQPSA
jgi:two-component system NtrC family sensor kinase